MVTLFEELGIRMQMVSMSIENNAVVVKMELLTLVPLMSLSLLKIQSRLWHKKQRGMVVNLQLVKKLSLLTQLRQQVLGMVTGT